MIELLCSSSTLRTLRSIGSWQGWFSRSIIFNSRTVAVIGTSRVMTLPCKVFNSISRDMAPKGPFWRSRKNRTFWPPMFLRLKNPIIITFGKTNVGRAPWTIVPHVTGFCEVKGYSFKSHTMGPPNRTWAHRLEYRHALIQRGLFGHGNSGQMQIFQQAELSGQENDGRCGLSKVRAHGNL